MHQPPQKPAETYIARLLLDAANSPGAETIRVSIAPDGSAILSRTGLMGDPTEGINLVAEVIGDKVKIVEKRASKSATLSSQCSPLRGVAQLNCFRKGHYTIRYESEVTGTWGTMTILAVDGFANETELRF
jgi:hypothetical protein